MKLIWRMEEQEVEVPVTGDTGDSEGGGEGGDAGGKEGKRGSGNQLVEMKKVLAPSWPVMILSRDVRFSNREPMEIGLEYSYKYWMNYDQGLVKYNTKKTVQTDIQGA